jgi:CMP-N-acetylneuraminic acid synthetase
MLSTCKSINSSRIPARLVLDCWRNGAIYIFRVRSNGIGSKLLAEPIIGYEMPWYQSVNIDTFQDLEIAELIAKKFLSNL